MHVLEVEESAAPLEGNTWLLETPEGMEPHLRFYFTYIDGRIVLQAVHEE